MENNNKLLEKILSNQNFLIIPDAARVDWDCLCSTLAIDRWLKKLGKNSHMRILGKMQEQFKRLPEVEEIKSSYPDDIDWDYYDMIILVDTSDWDRLLTRDYSSVLQKVDIGKFLLIDHHQPGNISENIGENIVEYSECCTGKVFYDQFFLPSKVELDREIAEYLYLCTISDTQFFKVLMQEDTFEFADKLMKAGIDRTKMTDLYNSADRDQMEFLGIAINFTDYYPGIQTTILKCNDEFNEEAEKVLSVSYKETDVFETYKEVFMRRVIGYKYGVIIYRKNKDGMTSLSWRTAEHGANIKILEVCKNLGMQGGGHFGAGTMKINMSMDDVESKFVQGMRAEMERQI